MSVLLVEEPTGDKLEERGVRGERRGSGLSRGWAKKVPKKYRGGLREANYVLA